MLWDKTLKIKSVHRSFNVVIQTGDAVALHKAGAREVEVRIPMEQATKAVELKTKEQWIDLTIEGKPVAKH